MGGAIFVMGGGRLVAQGHVTITADSVAAGVHAGAASDGSAFGGGLFLQGNGAIRFDPAEGQTEHVFDAIDDQAGVEEKNGYTPPGGVTPGSYRLVKSGLGTLILSADNAYSGGTALKGGTLDLMALGAAGTAAITFAGPATLEIARTALTSHSFANPIDAFGQHDVLDLSNLFFRAGAKAHYDKATHELTVHSGIVTDTLTLNAPLGTHFAVASDGHVGTEVFLVLA
jgi:autotransporter-associated beta strand protein